MEGNRASFFHNQNEKGIPQEIWMTLLKKDETHIFFAQETQQVTVEDGVSEEASMPLLMSLKPSGLCYLKKTPVSHCPVYCPK